MLMIWCQSCQTVVWAYDHFPPTEISGFLNESHMPCPLCGDKRNFDAIGLETDRANERVNNLRKEGQRVFDLWSLMEYIAAGKKLTWNPSDDNSWFRPHTTVVYSGPPIVKVTYSNPY